MATRMKQRRGTASQWTSTNNNQGPILEAGEIGFESDTGKFKIGDGANRWVALPYFLDENDLGGSLGDYLTVDDLGQPLKAASLDADGKLESDQFPDSVTIASISVGSGTATLGSTGSAWAVSSDSVTTGVVGNTLVISGAPVPTSPPLPNINGTYTITSIEDDGYGSRMYYSTQLDTVLSGVAGFWASSWSTFNISVGTSEKTISITEIGYLDGVTSAIQTQLNNKAPLASPALTGTPTAPTQSAGDNSTKIATTAYADASAASAAAAIVDSAPSALNTLNELAAALGDDANYAATIITALGDKAPLNSPTFTGTVDFTGATVDGIDALPTQSGNAGKYLTTDGTTASWAPAATETPHPFAMIG